MARPSEYNFEFCKDICEQIAGGDNILNILNKNENYPSWATFRRWKAHHEELQTLYIKSQQDKAIALENEIDDYRAMLLAKEIDASTYNVLVQTLKWKMAKFYPKVFGDRVINENVNVSKPVDLSKLSIDELEMLEKINKKIENSNS